MELSIIVPTLDEAACLPELLTDLGRQESVRFEVIVSDGGSTDETVAITTERLQQLSLDGQVVVGDRGRGQQLNRGAAAAKGDWLLFLHADSRFLDDHALRAGLDSLQSESAANPHIDFAGRFQLRFDLAPADYSFGYYFYEAKTRLDQPGCIHGDQGFLLSREFFERIGPYREDLPVMEDSSLAETIRSAGQWLLLPTELWTSPRRFQREGMKPRQALNAILMNFLDIGWDAFLITAPAIYRQQTDTKKLRLKPFIQEIHQQFAALSFREVWMIWMKTGAYVRSQAWQLVFARQARRCYRQDPTVLTTDLTSVVVFQSWFDPLTDHRLGHFITACLVKVWAEWHRRFGW
jgi:rSAM/selenodomain-associated transferase 2